MRGWAMMAGLMALAASPLGAQETRVAPEDHTPPPATLAQMDWLVGQWAGTGIGGAPAVESWLPPSGGTMVGTFVQETGEGAIRFTEHLYLMEEEGTLVLRLKHFNADLTGWEKKDGMLTFRLIAVEDCAAYFRSLTLRCDGESGLLAAVRMKSEDDEIRELVFKFRRVEGTSSENDFSRIRRCDGSMRQMEECAAQILKDADERRSRYFQAALIRLEDWTWTGHTSAATLEAELRSARAAFEAYRSAECGTIYDRQMGSIRAMDSLVCEIKLTNQRTRTIWESWLTDPEGGPPVLPEPQ